MEDGDYNWINNEKNGRKVREWENNDYKWIDKENNGRQSGKKGKIIMIASGLIEKRMKDKVEKGKDYD